MPHIPHETLEDILGDPSYRICRRVDDGGCSGNISFEEAITYGGRQVKDKWAIIPLCHYHHSIGIWQDKGGIDKRKNEWLALRQATSADLLRYSKAINYAERLKYLNKIYDKAKTK